MRKRQKDIEPMYGIIKEMYERGDKVQNIIDLLQISEWSIYKALSIMGIDSRTQQKKIQEETNLNYVEDRNPILEKVIVYGKWKAKEGNRYREKRTYTDIAPLVVPK